MKTIKEYLVPTIIISTAFAFFITVAVILIPHKVHTHEVDSHTTIVEYKGFELIVEVEYLEDGYTLKEYKSLLVDEAVERIQEPWNNHL